MNASYYYSYKEHEEVSLSFVGHINLEIEVLKVRADRLGYGVLGGHLEGQKGVAFYMSIVFARK